MFRGRMPPLTPSPRSLIDLALIDLALIDLALPLSVPGRWQSQNARRLIGCRSLRTGNTTIRLSEWILESSSAPSDMHWARASTW